MIAVTSFGPIAPFYDELMGSVDYVMWADYYELLLLQQGVAPDSLLDVACGTGLLSEIMASRGYQVTGFDLSEPMIAEAQFRAEPGTVEFIVADAGTVDLGRQFDAAYSFFDSLNYITDPAHLAAAMHRVAAHLPCGASWIFDVNTAYAFEKQLFTQSDLRKKSTIQYDWVGSYDPESRLIRVDMTFWKGGEQFHEVHVQRAYSDEELRAMLEDAGFGEVVAYHSYTLDKPRKNSDRLHYCCLRG